MQFEISRSIMAQAQNQAFVEALEQEIRQTREDHERNPWSDQHILTSNQAWRVITQETLEEIVRAVLWHEAPGATIDLGAGTGWLFGLLDDAQRADYIGVEPSQSFCEEFRRLRPDAQILRAGGESLPFASNSLPAIASLTVFDILTDPGVVAQEIHRVLRPGGIFIHFHDLRPNVFAALGRGKQLAFPRFRDHQMVGFTQVERRAVRQVSQHSLEWDLLRLCARFPPAVEAIYEMDHEMAEHLSRTLGSSNLPKKHSPSPLKIFEKLTLKHLSKSGLKARAFFSKAKAVVPIERINDRDPLIPWLSELIGEVMPDHPAAKLRNRYRVLDNATLSTSYDAELEAKIGPDQALVENIVHVIVARKPVEGAR